MDTRNAIEQIRAFDRRRESGDIRSAILYLISQVGDDVEQALLDVMAENSRTHTDPFAVAGRILAERDPDRDPKYLLRYYRRHKPIEGNSPLRRWMRRMEAYPPPGSHVAGLSRLRLFRPVPAYAKLMDKSWVPHRVIAANALGDTADPAALDPLAKGLGDPDKRVRTAAVDAVRRLSRTTSAGAVANHPIRQKLVAALADKDKKVALAAAYALVAIGDEASIQMHVANNPRRRRLFAGALAGEIPPLFPIWPGEETD